MATAHADWNQFKPFSISVVPDRERVTLVLDGDLDLSSCERFQAQVRELRTAGFERLVIDLRKLRFLDSSGLRTLLALRNHAERDGHELTMVPGPHGVQRVFELTGTSGLFEWSKD